MGSRPAAGLLDVEGARLVSGNRHHHPVVRRNAGPGEVLVENETQIAHACMDIVVRAVDALHRHRDARRRVGRDLHHADMAARPPRIRVETRFHESNRRHPGPVEVVLAGAQLDAVPKCLEHGMGRRLERIPELVGIGPAAGREARSKNRADQQEHLRAARKHQFASFQR